MTRTLLAYLSSLALLTVACGDMEESPTSTWEVAEVTQSQESGSSDESDESEQSAPGDSKADAPRQGPPHEESDDTPPEPAAPDRSTFESDVVELVNMVRSAGADCGEYGVLPAVPALAVDGALGATAGQHSQDLASRDIISHEGGDGSRFWDRAATSGYRGTARGENVAGGQPTPEEVVSAWVESDGHCMILLLDDITDIGVGYVFRENSTYRHFWTMVVGTR